MGQFIKYLNTHGSLAFDDAVVIKRWNKGHLMLGGIFLGGNCAIIECVANKALLQYNARQTFWFCLIFCLGVIAHNHTTPFTFSFLQLCAKPCAWCPHLHTLRHASIVPAIEHSSC